MAIHGAMYAKQDPRHRLTSRPWFTNIQAGMGGLESRPTIGAKPAARARCHVICLVLHQFLCHPWMFIIDPKSPMTGWLGVVSHAARAALSVDRDTSQNTKHKTKRFIRIEQQSTMTQSWWSQRNPRQRNTKTFENCEKGFGQFMVGPKPLKA